MNKIKYYSKEETNKIVELFMSKATRKECEDYAKSINRTYNEIKQKAYYEFSYNKKKKTKSTSNWTDGEITFLLNNWKSLSKTHKIKWAKSIGRTYSACDKMYYKSRKKETASIIEQKPASITISHTTKSVPERKAAIIKIGDVILELPNTTNSISINGNNLSW